MNVQRQTLGIRGGEREQILYYEYIYIIGILYVHVYCIIYLWSWSPAAEQPSRSINEYIKPARGS